MRAHKAWAILAVTLLAVASAGAVPAGAATGADPFALDVAQYAKSSGVSTAEAERRLNLQDDIGQLSQRLRDGEPATFGGLYIEHVPKYRVVVLMTTDAAQTIRDYLRGGPLEGVVETATVEHSLATLEADQQRLAKEFGATGWAVDLSVKQNRVEIQVPRGEKAPEARIVDSLPPTSIVVTDVEPRIPAAQLYGGLTISDCTLGFTIYYGSSTSNRGVATAGHCANAQVYNGMALTYQNDDLHSGDYDSQSHKLSGATYSNKIKDDNSGNTRSITGRSLWVNQNVGDFVCKYGKVTGYGCGYIVSDHDPGCNGGGNYLIKVDSDPNGTGYDLAEGGDSGGPWFLGNVAWGILSCQQGFDGIYLTTGFLESPLNAHVLTIP